MEESKEMKEFKAKKNSEKHYSNNHRSKQRRPKPKFIEFDVDADFAQMIVGKKVATKEFCKVKLWDYIRRKNLIQGKHVLVPDEYLATVLGSGQMNVFQGVHKFVTAHLKDKK